MTEPKEPSSLLIGMTEREMHRLMERLNICARVESFREAMKEAQKCALAEQEKTA
jgi:hypothetical protein